MFTESMTRKRKPQRRYAILAGAVLAGVVLGLIVPTLVAGITYELLGRARPNARAWLLPSAALLIGQAAWLGLSALAASAGLIVLGPFVLLMGAGALWLVLSNGARVPAILLIVVQAASSILGIVGLMVSPMSFTVIRALAAHVSLGLAIIVLLILLVRVERARPETRDLNAVFD